MALISVQRCHHPHRSSPTLWIRWRRATRRVGVLPRDLLELEEVSTETISLALIFLSLSHKTCLVLLLPKLFRISSLSRNTFLIYCTDVAQVARCRCSLLEGRQPRVMVAACDFRSTLKHFRLAKVQPDQFYMLGKCELNREDRAGWWGEGAFLFALWKCNVFLHTS